MTGPAAVATATATVPAAHVMSSDNMTSNCSSIKGRSSVSTARAMFESNRTEHGTAATRTVRTARGRNPTRLGASLPPVPKMTTTTTDTIPNSPPRRRIMTLSSSVPSPCAVRKPRPRRVLPRLAALNDSVTLTEAETEPGSTSPKNSQDDDDDGEQQHQQQQQQQDGNDENPQDANDDNHLKGLARSKAACTVQRAFRQWSHLNRMRRIHASQQFQQLQHKQEQDHLRIQQIKQGRQIKSIRNSLAHFEQTIEKNKQFGFDSCPLPKTKTSTWQAKRQQLQQLKLEQQQEEQQQAKEQETLQKERNSHVLAASAKDLEWQALQASFEDEETEEEVEQGHEDEEKHQTAPVTETIQEGEEEEEDDDVDAEVQSMTLSQLQDQHEAERKEKLRANNNNHASAPATTNIRRPQRLPSAESTLSPIRVPASSALKSLESSLSTLPNGDPPIPKFISFGGSGSATDALNESEISLPTRWMVSSQQQLQPESLIMHKQLSSRWISQPVSPKKKNPDVGFWEDPTPVCFRLPQAAAMQQPDSDSNSRWAVHPRVVYGKPKTQKAVQPNRNNNSNPASNTSSSEEVGILEGVVVEVSEPSTRWAAVAPAGKKKKIFPQNGSRWTAQPKGKKKTTKLPSNGQRMANGGSNGLLRPTRRPTCLPLVNGDDLVVDVDDDDDDVVAVTKSARPEKPKRQATRESLNMKVKKTTDFIAKPTRQVSKEYGDPIPTNLTNVARPSRKRSMSGGNLIKDGALPSSTEEKAVPEITTSMPMIDRSSNDQNDHNEQEEGNQEQQIDATTPQAKEAVARKKKTAFNRLRNRSLSLGEVKRIVSATRIQAFARMFLQRFKYRMERLEQLKRNIEMETQAEITHIQECLKLRLHSIRDKMEREHSMGLDTGSINSINSGGDDDDVAASLRTEMAAIEAVNNKLQPQCDRLRATNARLESGSKMRENAIKEVNARLKKLQHIQTKLNKVYTEFQAEYKAIRVELDETDRNLKKESILHDRTKNCIRKIVTFVRPKLTNCSSALLEELEDAVPLDCLM